MSRLSLKRDEMWNKLIVFKMEIMAKFGRQWRGVDFIDNGGRRLLEQN